MSNIKTDFYIGPGEEPKIKWDNSHEAQMKRKALADKMKAYDLANPSQNKHQNIRSAPEGKGLLNPSKKPLGMNVYNVGGERVSLESARKAYYSATPGLEKVFQEGFLQETRGTYNDFLLQNKPSSLPREQIEYMLNKRYVPAPLQRLGFQELGKDAVFKFMAEERGLNLNPELRDIHPGIQMPSSTIENKPFQKMPMKVDPAIFGADPMNTAVHTPASLANTTVSHNPMFDKTVIDKNPLNKNFFQRMSDKLFHPQTALGQRIVNNNTFIEDAVRVTGQGAQLAGDFIQDRYAPGSVRGTAGALMSRVGESLESGAIQKSFKFMNQQIAQPINKGAVRMLELGGKGALGAGKGLARGTFDMARGIFGSKLGVAALALGAGAMGFMGGAIDSVENTDPYSGQTARYLKGMTAGGGFVGGVVGLSGMALLANRDRTNDMRGADMAASMGRGLSKVDGPMSFGGNGGSRSGFDMGASGNLALSLHNLRRG